MNQPQNLQEILSFLTEKNKNLGSYFMTSYFCIFNYFTFVLKRRCYAQINLGVFYCKVFDFFLIHCSPICRNSRNLLILQINPCIKLKLIAESDLNTAKFATSEIWLNKMDLMIT